MERKSVEYLTNWKRSRAFPHNLQKKIANFNSKLSNQAPEQKIIKNRLIGFSIAILSVNVP